MAFPNPRAGPGPVDISNMNWSWWGGPRLPRQLLALSSVISSLTTSFFIIVLPGCLLKKMILHSGYLTPAVSSVTRKPSPHPTPAPGHKPPKASSYCYSGDPSIPARLGVYRESAVGSRQGERPGSRAGGLPTVWDSSGCCLSPPSPSPKRTPLLPPARFQPSRGTASSRRPCREPCRQPASAESALEWDLKAAA